MALAAATVFEGRTAGWLVGAVVVDHRLQPESAETARRVGSWLTDLGCDPVIVTSVDVGSAGGPEAAARTARYAALRAEATRHDAVVLLGHTRDDQAETVLLGLARGSGLRSIAGMRPATEIYRRPFLDVGRADTEAACRVLALQCWQDPHNADPAYARVRVRSRVLPVLESELGPGVSEALARTAALARSDANALDQIAEQLRADVTGSDGSLDVDALVGTHPSLLTRVLRRAALAAGSPAGELHAVHVTALLRLVTDWHGQHGVDLPGRVWARREHGRLRFEHRPSG
jgi:tRNA(Ile)-lysidine synthase